MVVYLITIAKWIYASKCRIRYTLDSTKNSRNAAHRGDVHRTVSFSAFKVHKRRFLPSSLSISAACLASNKHNDSALVFLIGVQLDLAEPRDDVLDFPCQSADLPMNGKPTRRSREH